MKRNSEARESASSKRLNNEGRKDAHEQERLEEEARVFAQRPTFKVNKSPDRWNEWCAEMSKVSPKLYSHHYLSRFLALFCRSSARFVTVCRPLRCCDGWVFGGL
jgi:hypothetical protein